MILTATLLASVPVDPDAPTARRWVVEELARPEYHTGRSLLQRLMDAISDFLSRLTSTGSGRLPMVLLAVAVLVAVAVGFWLVGPVRLRHRAAGADDSGVMADDTRTAAQMRGDATDAFAAGRWDEAVAHGFRAVIRTLEERVIISEQAGRTAHDAANAAAEAIGSLSTELHAASAVFDAVVYGSLPATSTQAERVLTLMRTSMTARAEAVVVL